MGESEALTTGWEPDIPDGDTILRQYVYNSADRIEHLATATGRAARRSGRLVLADLRLPSPFGNQAILLRPLAEADVPVVVEELRAGLSSPHVVFSAWPTPDLGAHGYMLVGHPPFMIRPSGGAPPSAPPELDITEVTDAASMEAYERVFVEGYPIPELQPYQTGRLFDTRVLGDIARAWVGAVEGRPVAGAMAFTSRGLVAVENVATLPEARGKGYGRALTAAATLSTPDLPAALIASDDGRSVYERLGYLAVSRFTLWVGA